MKCWVVWLVLCVTKASLAGLSSEEIAEVTETCCAHGESFAPASDSISACAGIELPDDLEAEQVDTCKMAVMSCCEHILKEKKDCKAGIKLSEAKRCGVPKTNIGKTCCEECSLGSLTGETQGREACGEPADEFNSPTTALRKNAYHDCCMEAARKAEQTTTTPKPSTTSTTTTTQKPTTTKKPENCKTNNPCEQICIDKGATVACTCEKGYRLKSDGKTCKDINECGESLDDLCITEGYVCHNTPGSYRCVPVKKRDVGRSCPPGFKRNVLNQVCDDINECQLPRPPCPKYLCENTIGGFKCAGKPGKPAEEAVPGVGPRPDTEPNGSVGGPSTAKDNMCPPGFRAGPGDECVDIDECYERLDDCQRLSQHCINTHGTYFCQDHVSKRCSPGFKVNVRTGVCEDIDECEDSPEVCKASEVCVNLPGAYDCKSKISTLPKLAPSKSCQEGTRLRAGGTGCEDIDECREGTHLCDQFQNCINTYGAHECRCKNGFELDSTSSSCVDIDECVLKLDNCGPGKRCINVLGSFTCTRAPASPAPSPAPSPASGTAPGPAPGAGPGSTLPPEEYEYEYYDSDEEANNDTIAPTTSKPNKPAEIKPISSSTTLKPTASKPPAPKPQPRPYIPPNRPNPTTTPRASRPYDSYDPYTSNRTPSRVLTTTSTTERSKPKPDTNAVSVPIPKDPNVIEKERDNDGSYNVDTADIPKDKWTVVVGKDKGSPTDDDFDLNELHCLNGYEKNENGDCVDIDECTTGRHICNSLEVCTNRAGGYVCECSPGFKRDTTGWCVAIPIVTSVTTTTTETPVVAAPPTPPPSPLTPPPTTPLAPRPSAPEWPYATPRTWGRPYVPPIVCELGYEFSAVYERCIDIDECTTGKASCSSEERCVNTEGGYRCVCSSRSCLPEPSRPNYVPLAPAPSQGDRTAPAYGGSNVITVGSQFGQRGPRHMRPTYKRMPDSGAILTSCLWGYKLTLDKQCFDIDECALNATECGPQQRCENFYGGYSCQCPEGHRLVPGNLCEDIDECTYGNPCSTRSQCVNIAGSYRCTCSEGFRNPPSSDKVCSDVDECAEQPALCEHGCVNVWGGYRCTCAKGYRVGADNRTCVDIDECTEWSSSTRRGRLCVGECVNTPGSYRCACPAGYRTSEDGRSCVDIDECETGVATCSNNVDQGEVCLNTRGSYHCHRINCPSGYRLEGKHRCSRIQRSCPYTDWGCIHQPSAYSYNFITFTSHIYMPDGRVDLFTMHGPEWASNMLNFEMKMVDVQAPANVRAADLSCFDMRPSGNVCVVSLVCALSGPQSSELELTMSLYRRGQYEGSAVARLIVVVSPYDY